MTEKVKVPDWFDDFYKQKSEQGKRDIQLIYGLANLQNTDLRWLDEESSAIKTRPINNKDRLRFIKAIVNGYEVEEQKYGLPMEGTNFLDANEEYLFYASIAKDGSWIVGISKSDVNELPNRFYVAQSQIDSAPAWVKAIKPVPIEEADDNG